MRGKPARLVCEPAFVPWGELRFAKKCDALSADKYYPLYPLSPPTVTPDQSRMPPAMS